MSTKKFTSSTGWFTMSLPLNWEEYEDEDTEEGTYAFFNANSWTGNLRITPLKNSDSSERDMAAEFLHSELEENQGAKKLKLGDLDAVHYKDDSIEESTVTYYWAAGYKNILFMCSFTTDKDKEKSEQNEKELELVKNILSSIEINDLAGENTTKKV